jgi:large subunit ribosomal protein L24
MHVKTKDIVVVLTGKSSGHRGRVLSVEPDADRALVEGANLMRKHTRANPRKGMQGGILEREGPVHVSNLMVVCPQCDQPTRVANQRLSNGRRVRKCRRCEAQIDK